MFTSQINNQAPVPQSRIRRPNDVAKETRKNTNTSKASQGICACPASSLKTSTWRA